MLEYRKRIWRNGLGKFVGIQWSLSCRKPWLQLSVGSGGIGIETSKFRLRLYLLQLAYEYDSIEAEFRDNGDIDKLTYTPKSGTNGLRYFKGYNVYHWSGRPYTPPEVLESGGSRSFRPLRF